MQSNQSTNELEKRPLVSIIIINWNGIKLLERFISSIDEIDYGNLEIIFVDNNSTDNSIEYIKTYHPHFNIIKSQSNLGTSGGSNFGALHARGKYIFFTGNDMIYNRDLITCMVAPMEADNSIGATACKVLLLTDDGQKTNIIDTVGAQLDIFGFGSGRGYRQEDNKQFDEDQDIFFAYGCSILVRRDLFNQVNGYDDNMFSLTDDIDLCWRIQLLNKRIRCTPKGFLHHRSSSTLGVTFNRSQTRYMSERHNLRMLLKNYSLFAFILIMPVYFLILMMEFIFYLVIARFSMSFSLAKAIWWNMLNIKSTITQRVYIQQTRTISDFDILRRLNKTSFKFKLFFDFVKNFRSEYWKNFFDS
ncbi:glycosyltransferase family 2 protein [Patescibacteria group bacterium]|nr:glycosyltransferase family 2 protein [Patescibacteria group bacterium]